MNFKHNVYFNLPFIIIVIDSFVNLTFFIWQGIMIFVKKKLKTIVLKYIEKVNSTKQLVLGGINNREKCFGLGKIDNHLKELDSAK